jgi:enamine deaminase RidA (YjgF/YER057c/UK114 family)
MKRSRWMLVLASLAAIVPVPASGGQPEQQRAAQSEVAGGAPAATVQHLDPPTLPKVPFLSQIVVVENGRRFAHIAGQTAMNTDFQIVGTTLSEQVPTVLRNLDHALAAANAKRGDLVKLMVLFVDREAKEGSSARGQRADKPGKTAELVTRSLRRYFGDGPMPAITYVGVASLVAPGMLLEIEGLALVRS